MEKKAKEVSIDVKGKVVNVKDTALADKWIAGAWFLPLPPISQITLVQNNISNTYL